MSERREEGKKRTIWVEVEPVRISKTGNLKPNESRKERSDKRERVNITTDKDTHEKLRRLAFACGVSKTALMADIANIVLNNENWVNFIQDKYQVNDNYRLTPARIEGRLYY